MKQIVLSFGFKQLNYLAENSNFRACFKVNCHLQGNKWQKGNIMNNTTRVMKMFNKIIIIFVSEYS